MEKRRLGSSDLMASEIGLGCNNFGARGDQAMTDAVVDAALDVGINFFDTADVYAAGASETQLGKALGARRGDVILATKYGMSMGEGRGGASRRWTLQACEDSLRRLGTDYIDYFQIHRPDPETPIEETIQALEDLRKAGKIRWYGCTVFTARQMEEAAAAAGAMGAPGFVSGQDNYSLVAREAAAEIIPACERLGMSFLPFFPLASGLLSGKYRRGVEAPAGTRLGDWKRFATVLNDRNYDRVERLTAWAGARGHTILELAFAWLLAHPVVASVIAGATSADQIRANAATAAWRLTPAEAREVDALAS